MNAYYICTGANDDNDNWCDEHGIVIARSRGHARSFVCGEFGLVWTWPISIRLLCEVEDSAPYGWNEDIYVSVYCDALLKGECEEQYTFQAAIECGEITV